MRIGAALVIFVGGIFSLSTTHAGVHEAGAREVGDVRQSIARALEDSVAGWNTGDLDRFLGIYEDSPETTILLPRGTAEGLAAIRKLYTARFAKGHSTSLGRLRVDIVKIELLDGGYALLIGRYRLMQDGKVEEKGQTTLLFHHSAAGWRIINDHTC